MIEVQHVTKRYGRVTAVDDVSFRVEPGEILGFLGPNGAGKTTTMQLMLSLIHGEGCTLFDGQSTPNSSSPAAWSAHCSTHGRSTPRARHGGTCG